MKARKYLLACTAVAVLSTASFVGCSSNNNSNTGNANVETSGDAAETTGAYVDGTYTKVADEADNGYTYQVEMVVEGGKITAINWDALDADGNSKKEAANNGTYVMTEDGPTWTEQSDALAQYVIDNQSLDGLTMDESGKTDAVAGVSISIDGFVEFVQDCINQATTGNANAETSTDSTETTGAFVDGTYTKVADEADNGYTYQVEMVVEGGNITAINWDALDADGNSKKEAANNGTYVMTEDGPTWTEQSDALAQYVIDNQSLDGLTMDESGKTDAVAGVSISVGGFVEFVQDCMNQATAQ